MNFLNKTKEFFAEGGMIFSSKHNFLAKSVQALGLAAIVTVFPPVTADAQVALAGVSPILPIAQNAHALATLDTPVLKKIAYKLSTDTVSTLRASWKTAEEDLAKQNVVEIIDGVIEEGVSGSLSTAAEFVSYHAEKTALNVTSHEFGQYKINHYVAKEILRAAQDTNFPADTLFAIAEKESSFDIQANPKTSSAFGLMQFLDQKWLEMVKTHGSDYGLEYEAGLIKERAKSGRTEYYIENKNAQERILELRTSPYLSTVFTAINLLDAKNKIESRVNTELKNEELYLPHFLGTNGAGKLIEESANKPNTTASKIFPAAARANKNMFKGKGGKALTISQFKERIVATIGQRTEKYTDIETIIAEASIPQKKDDEENNIMLVSMKP